MTLRKFHKYISLLVSIQLLLWTISGIYFAFNKIENVRGEQYLKNQEIEINQTQTRSEKLSHEIIEDIVVKETYLEPTNIMLIQEQVRGSEYRGKKLPIYKVTSNIQDNIYEDSIKKLSNKYNEDEIQILYQIGVSNLRDLEYAPNYKSGF